MAIARAFWNWQEDGEGHGGARCSPNLVHVRAALQERWPWLAHLGCYSPRPVRGSATVPSSHSYGAALDLGYPTLEDPAIEAEVAPFLVAWSLELGIDAIHDYRRCRIWRAGRTPDESQACTGWWRAQKRSATTGMGMSWASHIHIETHVLSWGWDADPSARGIT